MSQQQVTALCLLDLSAAFDTINHSNLILISCIAHQLGLASMAKYSPGLHHRPTCHHVGSWSLSTHLLLLSRGSNLIYKTVLAISILKTPNHLYSNIFMEFLKDPSLVLYSSSYIPILSVLSYLIKSANHQLYADDTQLLISFSALDFSHNITHLENTITNVSNSMSSNFLSLNPSKLSFSSLVYHNTSLNSIILPFIYLTMSHSHLLILLVILVSSLIQIICTTYLFYF